MTGPRFFATMAGGWRFKTTDGGALATWKLAPPAERIGARVLAAVRPAA
jgi:hypothetical protein